MSRREVFGSRAGARRRDLENAEPRVERRPFARVYPVCPVHRISPHLIVLLEDLLRNLILGELLTNEISLRVVEVAGEEEGRRWWARQRVSRDRKRWIASHRTRACVSSVACETPIGDASSREIPRPSGPSAWTTALHKRRRVMGRSRRMKASARRHLFGRPFKHAGRRVASLAVDRVARRRRRPRTMFHAWSYALVTFPGNRRCDSHARQTGPFSPSDRPGEKAPPTRSSPARPRRGTSGRPHPCATPVDRWIAIRPDRYPAAG